jgi:CxxC motif-containing protein (DUF1111 family)
MGALLFSPYLGRAETDSGNSALPIEGTDEPTERLFFLGRNLFLNTHEPPDGLGPAFNASGCVSCHHVPVAGGSGNIENVVTLIGRLTRGRFDDLPECGGPIFQAHTISGLHMRTVPKGATRIARRIPPSLFGLGLVEEIPQSRIWARIDPYDKNGDGIRGRANVVNGELGRFGAKAQISSLFEFMFTAARAELGLTSPYLMKELPTECEGEVTGDLVADPELAAEQVFNLMYFVKFLPPPMRTDTAGIERGERIFQRIGCSDCHTPSFVTESRVSTLNAKQIFPYSDFLIHDMGESLADGIVQSMASSRDFRTSPLWGLGTRKLYLHDGRATSVPEAITLHEGEALRSAERFLELKQDEQIELLKFLGSL